MRYIEKIQLQNDIESDKAFVQRLEEAFVVINKNDPKRGAKYREKIESIKQRIADKEVILKGFESSISIQDDLTK